MCKFILIVALTFSTVSINAQSSIKTFLVTPDYSGYFPTNAKSVKEKVFYIISSDEGQPDTTITYLGKTYFLKFSQSIFKTDAGNGKIEMTNYKQDGSIQSRGYRIFINDLLMEDVDIQEDEALQSMNYNKSLSYKKGKLTKIIEKPCETCDIKSKIELIYDQEMFPKEIIFENSFIGGMNITRSKEENNFRYDYEMVVSEEMKALFEQMGENSNEREAKPYDEVVVNENNKSYTIIHYNFDKELKEYQMETKITMSNDGIILSEETYYGGELSSQIKFEYNDKDQLKSCTDMDGTVYSSEFNKHGQCTKKRENNKWIVMEYDAHGNMIKSASLYGDSLSSITFYEIEY